MASSALPWMRRRQVLDAVNTAFWFIADGVWLCGYHGTALVLMVPTVLTSALIIAETLRRKGPIAGDLTVLAWILMNGCWIASDALAEPRLLAAARVGFAVGGVFLVTALVRSRTLRSSLERLRRARL